MFCLLCPNTGGTSGSDHLITNGMIVSSITEPLMDLLHYILLVAAFKSQVQRASWAAHMRTVAA